MNAILTILATILYTFGAYYMKQADGFARLPPVILVFAFFCLGATLQIYAMRHEEMSRLYVISLGIQVIGAFLFGAMLFGEPITWQKIAGAAIVCAGAVILQQ